MKWSSLVVVVLIFSLLISCKEEDIGPADVDTPQPEKPLVPAPDTVVVAPEPKGNSAKPDSLEPAIYLKRNFEDLPFRLMIPSNYDSTRKYPIVIFLHGIGESGRDNEKQLTWGATLFQADSIRRKYPAFIVFPQCPVNTFWFRPHIMNKLDGMLTSLANEFSLDSTRHYICGLSMGAYGTYAYTPLHAGTFAAAIAISGDGDSKQAKLLAKTSWWIFAGGKDKMVHPSKSEKMARVIKEAGAQVRFTKYEDADHGDSWERAFAEPDFLYWLFSQHK